MKCDLCNKEFNKNGYFNHRINCEKTIHLKPIVIDLYLKDLKSTNEIEKITGLSGTKVLIYLSGLLRNFSESGKIAHKKFPEKFKHTDESKNKLRIKRLEWMKNNPEKTAWRTSNFSYPEKLFFNKLLDLKWNDKYLIVREKSFFPYFIDFAFVNEKVAVEIDGSQHLLPERKKSDDKKDKLLIEEGWTVIRISVDEIKNNIDNCMEIILKSLNSKIKNVQKIGNIKEIEIKTKTKVKIKNIKVGIIKEPKKRIKKERINGFTEGEIQRILKQRKIERVRKNIEKYEHYQFFMKIGKYHTS